MGKAQDAIGKKFGILTVVKICGKKNSYNLLECLCDCGKTRITNLTELTRKRTCNPSCGCLKGKREDNWINRFFNFVIKKNGCWDWKGSINKSGYTQFYLKSKNTTGHRTSWIIHKGEIPETMCVCHICDNPRCVNPDHLFLGTHKENTQDMIKKERRVIIRKIEKNNYNKIFEMYSNNIPQHEIANIYGVTQTTISKILLKKFSKRTQIGSSNQKAVFTEDQVLKIRKEYQEKGKGCWVLSKKYGVSHSTIKRIINRKTWKHI